MPFASWTAPASVESVAQLRQAVVDFAYQHGVAEPCLSDIRLAVSEAVTNAVVHAFRGRADGTVIASVTTGASEWVEVRVSDDGSGMAPRDDSPGIGLGLPLIRHLTDQFEHRRPPGSVGTELRMRFRLALARVLDPSHPPPTQPALAATPLLPSCGLSLSPLGVGVGFPDERAR